MALTNRQIAQIFLNIADMLELQGESKFRFLSYRRAGEVLQEYARPLADAAADNTLEDIPGVGKAIADKIREALATGQIPFYEKLKLQVPESLIDIMNVNGVGPKKAKLFWDQLGIITLDALKTAAEGGKLRDLPGMGVKSEQKILDGLATLSRQGGRVPIGKARPIAEAIVARLQALPQVQEAIAAGSLRRGRNTIGDLDILVASEDPLPIMDAFVKMPEVVRILGQGDTKSSVELDLGLQVDLRVIPRSRWGAAMQYFTGNKDHNIKMRELALKKGYTLNEYAFSPVDKEGNIIPDVPQVTFETEEEIYAFVGLPCIQPEMRENDGEFEAARAGKLPNLIVIEDIKADLHMHTTWSDGTLSIREMAEAALARGRKFIVITDHSQASVIANGLTPERLMEQQKEVRQVAAEMADRIHILHGVEMDIKGDGGLDLPDEILAQLDFVIASLHFGLSQPREQVTQRLLNAIQNPHVDLIGHPTGRLLPDRDPADLDMERVFAAAKASGVALEINANPRRLDLDAPYVRRAIELGIPISINTDSHSADNMDLLPYGITQARRGWAEAKNVINTWDYETFLKWVQARGK
jgi:DNA polymerase (family X)